MLCTSTERRNFVPLSRPKCCNIDSTQTCKSVSDRVEFTLLPLETNPLSDTLLRRSTIAALQWKRSIRRVIKPHKSSPRNTVIPLYSGHSWDQKKVSAIANCLLYRGTFHWICSPRTKTLTDSPLDRASTILLTQLQSSWKGWHGYGQKLHGIHNPVNV